MNLGRPQTTHGIDRWRIERAGAPGGRHGYGRGWLATNLRTDVGGWFPRFGTAVGFVMGQQAKQADRLAAAAIPFGAPDSFARIRRLMTRSKGTTRV